MWIDISHPISAKLALYPDDEAFTLNQSNFTQGKTKIITSSVHTGLHFGTHTDAPLHFIPTGLSIDQVDLNKYIGRCQIINLDLSQRKHKIILPSDLPSISEPRVLIATNTFDYTQDFNPNFATLHPELTQNLIQQNCILIGIDTPSVDPCDQLTDFENHLQLLSNNIAIIEGLKLHNIPSGIYEMIAIPLAYEGLEASPLRVLIKQIKANYN